MIFSLLRPDVFSIGDIGLVKAVKMLVPEAETKEQVLEVANRWKPYRTAAAGTCGACLTQFLLLIEAKLEYL